MEEKELNINESLSIINSMINRAQNNLSDNSFYFIFWGWLVFSSALIHYCLLQLEVEKAYCVWLLMPLGGIVSFIYGARKKKKEKVKTYLGTYMTYLWGSLGISLLLVLFMMEKIGVTPVYSFLLIIYGIGTFVSGGMLRFKPLINGGLICFLLSVVSVFVDFDIQLLLIAAAILVSYIIPGHLLKAKFN